MRAKLSNLTLMIAFASVVAGIFSGSCEAQWYVEPLVNSGAREIRPIWSPDGLQIAYLSNESGVFQLYIINSDGTGNWQVTNNPADPVRDFVWAPDSQAMIYSRDQRPGFLKYIRMNATRTAVIQTCTLAQETNHLAGWDRPRFSQAGDQIVANWGYDGWPELRCTTFDNCNVNWHSVGRPTMSGNAMWAPDGSVIAYTHYANYQCSNLSELRLVEASGANDTLILSKTQMGQHCMGLAWSPDGGTIAYAGDTVCTPSRIGLVNSDGTNQRILDDGPAYFSPQIYSWQADIWSQDGASIVYSCRESGNWNLYTIDVDGTSKTLVASGGSKNYEGRFSVDGRIAFLTNREGDWDIYIAIEAPIVVGIDIYPNRTPNRIYLNRPYTIYVAVLGSSDLDVTSLDSTSVKFGRTGSEASPTRAPVLRDLNGDGFIDAMYGFLTPDCGFQLGDTQGRLTGCTTNGTPVEGVDSVLVSP